MDDYILSIDDSVKLQIFLVIGWRWWQLNQLIKAFWKSLMISLKRSATRSSFESNRAKRMPRYFILIYPDRSVATSTYSNKSTSVDRTIFDRAHSAINPVSLALNVDLASIDSESDRLRLGKVTYLLAIEPDRKRARRSKFCFDSIRSE